MEHLLQTTSPKKLNLREDGLASLYGVDADQGRQCSQQTKTARKETLPKILMKKLSSYKDTSRHCQMSPN